MFENISSKIKGINFEQLFCSFSGDTITDNTVTNKFNNDSLMIPLQKGKTTGSKYLQRHIEESIYCRKLVFAVDPLIETIEKKIANEMINNGLLSSSQNIKERSFKSSSVQTNEFNENRLKFLRTEITPKFIKCIKEEVFEFGYISSSELIVKEQLEINELATKNWLTGIFVENFPNTTVLVGILRLIGRFDEKTIHPQGMTMALAALSHKNTEVKELGVRAFENWASETSLKCLQSINVSVGWLQDYIKDVIEDIRDELCLY